MNATLESRLEQIKNRITRYELAAEHADGRRILVGYTIHRSRSGIMSLLRQRLTDGSLAHLGDPASTMLSWRKPAARGADYGPWRVCFTGRTQRDCILSDELPFIGDLPVLAS